MAKGTKKISIDSGITKLVDSTTLGDLFIGVSQKINYLWEAAEFSEKMINLA